MPELPNARYEKVAQARAQGASQYAAVISAGFTKDSANRICRRQDVQARVHELNPTQARFLPPPKRYTPRRKTFDEKDVITLQIELAQACRAAGNFREANIALKAVAALMAVRDGLHAKPKPTKKQREQRQRDEPDPEGESDDQSADNGGTPDISEIADVVGRLHDGPGDLTEEEADRAVAGGPAGSVHEADGNG